MSLPFLPTPSRTLSLPTFIGSTVASFLSCLRPFVFAVAMTGTLLANSSHDRLFKSFRFQFKSYNLFKRLSCIVCLKWRPPSPCHTSRHVFILISLARINVPYTLLPLLTLLQPGSPPYCSQTYWSPTGRAHSSSRQGWANALTSSSLLSEAFLDHGLKTTACPFPLPHPSDTFYLVLLFLVG